MLSEMGKYFIVARADAVIELRSIKLNCDDPIEDFILIEKNVRWQVMQAFYVIDGLYSFLDP